MKTVRRVFLKISEEKPYWSSYVVFANTVRGQFFSRKTINYWFNKLVEKDNFVEDEKTELINHLYNYSNGE